jgi:hypothetical protein
VKRLMGALLLLLGSACTAADADLEELARRVLPAEFKIIHRLGVDFDGDGKTGACFFAVPRVLTGDQRHAVVAVDGGAAYVGLLPSPSNWLRSAVNDGMPFTGLPDAPIRLSRVSTREGVLYECDNGSKGTGAVVRVLSVEEGRLSIVQAPLFWAADPRRVVVDDGVLRGLVYVEVENLYGDTTAPFTYHGCTIRWDGRQFTVEHPETRIAQRGYFSPEEEAEWLDELASTLTAWPDAPTASGRLAKDYAPKRAATPAPETVSSGSQPTGIIAFIRDGNLWLAASDGNSLRSVTDTGDYHAPVLPLDGSTIICCRGGEWDPIRHVSVDATICRVNLASGQAQALVRGNNPALAPDGQTLAFDRFGGSGAGSTRSVYLLNLKSGEGTALVGDWSSFDSGEGPRVAGWDQGGKAILLCGSNETFGSAAVYVLSVATGSLRRLTYGYSPQSSPQAEVIVGAHMYRDEGGSAEQLWNVPLSARGEGVYPPPGNRLTNWTMSEECHQVSPSGRWVAFCATDPAGAQDTVGHNVFVVYDLEARIPQTVLRGKGPLVKGDPPDQTCETITWCPDEERLCLGFKAYQDDGTASSSLWLVNRDGSALHKLADNAECPAWLPAVRSVTASASPSSSSGPSPAIRVTRAQIEATRCECPERGQHGDVTVTMSDGTGRQLTRTGNCRDPQVARDGQTVGWLEGSHVDVWGQQHFLTDKLVVWRAGEVVQVAESTPDRPGIIWGWRFVDDEARVALAIGAGKRGVQWYELREITSGRTVEVSANPAYAGSGTLPDWGTGLPE